MGNIENNREEYVLEVLEKSIEEKKEELRKLVGSKELDDNKVLDLSRELDVMIKRYESLKSNG